MKNSQQDVKKILPLNLQLFAEKGAGDNGTGELDGSDSGNADANGVNLDASEKKPKLFTQADIDRRVSEGISKREAKLKKDFDDNIENILNTRLTEHKRLSQLSEAEREKEAYEQRLKKLDERELALNNMQLKGDVLAELSSFNLSGEALSLIVGDSDVDAECAKKRIELLKGVVEKSVQMALNEKLRGSQLNLDAGETTEITAEDFKKMDYNERLKILNSNEKLYDSLVEGLSKLRK